MMYALWAGACFTTASGVILQTVVHDMDVCSFVMPSAVEESFCAASMSSSLVNASTNGDLALNVMNCLYSIAPTLVHLVIVSTPHSSIITYHMLRVRSTLP